MKQSKPSRKDLVEVIGDLQSIFGQINIASSDRNPNRAKEIAELIEKGHRICVEARSYDPPS